MKKLFIILSIVSFIQLNSQTNVYHSFPTSNSFWQYRHWNALNSYIQDQTRYGLNGDTIISGTTYKKVFSLFDSTLTNPYSTYYAAIREQNKKIYTVIGNLPEHLLYDFNLLTGDTIHYDYSLFSHSSYSFSRIVTKIDSMLLLDGRYRKRFIFDPVGNSTIDTVVEGIGSIMWVGLFNPLINTMCTCGDEYEVTCIKQNDTVLYLKNPACNHCFCTFLTTINGIERESATFIYPNPTSGQFCIETNTMDKLTVDLYDLNGRHVYSKTVSDQEIVDVTALNEGVYTLTIKTLESIINKKLVIVR